MNENQASTGLSNDTYYRDKFNKVISEIFMQCQELIRTKNADYTKLFPSDPFHNFRTVEIDTFLRNKGVSGPDSILLALFERMEEKRSRIYNLLLTEEQLVMNESIRDTIQDHINILAILLSHLEINGSKLLEKSEPQRTFKDQELDEAREDIQRLARQFQGTLEENQKLYAVIDELKNSNNKISPGEDEQRFTEDCKTGNKPYPSLIDNSTLVIAPKKNVHRNNKSTK